MTESLQPLIGASNAVNGPQQGVNVQPGLCGAAAVVRGVSRLFARNDIWLIPEVTLPNNRRADLMGIDARGHIVIIEVKVARADLLSDEKWPEYCEYCDRFYWAISPDLDIGLLDRESHGVRDSGAIIADAYDAEMVRAAPTAALPAARRKAMTIMLGRLAMRKLLALSDPGLVLPRG